MAHADPHIPARRGLFPFALARRFVIAAAAAVAFAGVVYASFRRMIYPPVDPPG